MESSFVVFQILPHHKNFNKRLIKAPKLYFFDTGLLCYLLRIKNPDDLRISPFRGNIFENFCISEFVKSAYHRKVDHDIFYWRDTSGHEIDMVIEQGDKLRPVEIKSGETFTTSFTDGLRYWLNLANQSPDTACLLYGGEKRMLYKGIRIIPWHAL